MLDRIKKLSAILLFSAMPALAGDIAGTWTLSMTGPQGAEVFDILIETDGSNFEVAGDHPALGPSKGAGTLEGDSVEMSLVTTGEMVVEFIFEGTVDGDEMSGTREFKMGGGAPVGPGGAPGNAAPGGAAPGSGGTGAAPGGAPGELPNDWRAIRK